MRRLLTASIALIALLVSVGPPASAGQIEPKFAAYLETLAENDFASAIVYLADQPDIASLDRQLRADRAPMSVRHATVMTALQQAAARSQPPILAYLDSRKAAGNVEGYTPYWIMNLVVVSATKGELRMMADRTDIDTIEGNFRATLIESDGSARGGPPIAGIGVTNSLKAINAPRVWRELHITGLGALIANLDTGVDGTHPALSARWRGNDHPWNECWRDALGTNTQFPSDGNGHGTHTMGTMTGLGIATADSVGVAFDAQWIADNAINQGVGSAFDNDVLDAFQWFADPDGNPNTTDDVPDVVQNSWGIDARFGGTYQDCDYRWQGVIDNCEAAGVVVTFSAGNEGPNPQTHRSPANICNTPTVNFAVGAVDCENYGWPYPIASFSSRGPSDCDGVTIKPEVAAPGVNVYSSYPGGGYVRMSGTSMAGPHVAGVVALMRQANPNADVQTIKSILMSTARDLGTAGEDNSYGWGVIDAYAAVRAVMTPDNTPPTVTVTAPNGGESWAAGSSHAITWSASDDVGVTRTTIEYSFDGGTSYVPVADLGGNPGSYAWTVPDTPSSQCLVRVTAFDQANNQGSDPSDGFFTIVQAPSPYVYVEYVALELVTKGQSTNAKATVRILDENGTPVNGAQVQSHWSGLTQDADVFTTRRNGIGTCNSDKLRSPNGCWNYNVDNVVVAGHVFRGDLGQTSGIICTAGKRPEAPAAGAFSVTKNLGPVVGGGSRFTLTLPAAGHVRFEIYNVLGQRVRTLIDEQVAAGIRTVTWDGTGDAGEPVPSGIYMYRVFAGKDVVTQKTVLIR